MLRINNYLSWSQYNLFLRSPAQYRRVYILGEPSFKNIEMEFGSKIADGLEKDELTGDPEIDFCKSALPKVDEKEKVIKVKLGDIPLLTKMDGFTEPNIIHEYKTGHSPWTQSKADKFGQITFYALAFFLKTNKIPETSLFWIPTKKENGVISLTGEKPIEFKTKRGISDFTRLAIGIKKVWKGIGEMVEAEL